jgi:hypothetical protein
MQFKIDQGNWNIGHCEARQVRETAGPFAGTPEWTTSRARIPQWLGREVWAIAGCLPILVLYLQRLPMFTLLDNLGGSRKDSISTIANSVVI